MTDTPNPGALADRLKPSADADADDVEFEVEEALGRLEALPDLPVTEHVQVFEGVQQRLSEILSNVDDA
ncbi:MULTISPECIES: hypothetical protein [Glycomyces]|uniref:Uncharacterized protein n=2 Tax=Glycomyces TaxID=58113 RepID=A0A9X3PP42_9ACTN|nr:hypothetical protein [Glycomyces lechevalierae]MDA1386647.1 hypothetical protein [Glycomyces lechevalierae]MDR7340715.1 hypothetical protein [Glycomyces lechevalierae]